jgi:arylsulfatase A-like enzyme
VRLLAALLLAGLVVGCSCDDDGEAAPADADAPAAEPLAEQERGAKPIHDLLANLHNCEIRHRGISLDLGTRVDKSRRGFRVGPFEDTRDVSRGGATYTRLLARKTSYEFSLDEPIEGLFVSARVHGGAAKRMNIVLDDRRLGSVKITPGETRIVSVPPLAAALGAGRHVVTLSFVGRPPPEELGFAEVDWIRIGVEDDISATYAAPTREDIVSDVALDGRPRRAIVLRAPSTVRCPVRVSSDAKLKFSLGFWGSGRGTAEVRVVADGEAPVKLAERKIAGGAGATWVPLELELGAHGSRIVGLELSVLEASRGGRVVFGDPALVRGSEELPRIPEAQTVVLIVAAGLERRHVPPWGPTAGLTAVGEIARQGTAFSGYRVSSTVAGAVVASILSGLPPRAHALEDPAARLPMSVRTISEMFKEAGGRTAMFTAAPTTFAAFGFEGGWDRYERYSPVKDVPAAEPLEAAAKWLEGAIGEDGAPKRLLVVHARGAHPPWDIAKDDAAKLPPEEYAGPIDARRGAITLGNVRARRLRAQRKLDDEDWVRLRALESAALARQNDGLLRIMQVLQKKGAWNDALVILVGDVAPGDPPEVPFDPAGPLGEDRLGVPLLVKFPSGRFATKEVATGASEIDITRTVLAALRVGVPEEVRGIDLFQLAAGVEPLAGRPNVAVMGDSYATRLGSLLLAGQIGRAPTLCQLDVDPACLTDVFAKMPIAATALWQWTHDFEASARDRRRSDREPASVDADTAAALTVWGDM